MRLLVSGTRETNTTQDEFIFDTLTNLNYEYNFQELIEGGARGVDRAARLWASRNYIPIKTVLAEWDKHGKSAGSIRNKAMLRFKPDLVVAFPAFQSIGTRHMISIAKEAGIKTLIYEV